jgi:hypothetical protein
MMHMHQGARCGVTAQRPVGVRALVGLLAIALGLAGCGDDGGIDPDELLFGQVGSIDIRLEVPLAASSSLGAGELVQDLRWASTGTWSREDSISYRGVLGDASTVTSTGDPSPSALAYDGLIRQLNEKESIKLFVLDDTIPEDCGDVQSRITFTIRDDARDQTVSWVRCVQGSLDNLTTEGAGPLPDAARLAQAALLARGATVGDSVSPYLGSVPFGTLDRGGNSASRLTAPAAYIDATGFHAFWAGHAPGTAPPVVDFSKDMVVVGIVGIRPEAGDSVEVRRILQVDQGTVIEVVERLPGKYCSPAARMHVPYHVVVAPRTPIPHHFADIEKEPVSCGG